ncbi:hypothetical protein AB0B10_25230 [Micromonospora arborensis]|uniref:hypothetical protein n=1 Tax=Micromonospora arborensis TaxID=2116518 RepID=UPI0033EFB7EB
MPSAGAQNERKALADLLSRYRIGGQPISSTDAQAAADRILAVSRLSAAELNALGYRHLTVVHGDVETPEDQAAMRQLWSWGDRHPGAVQSTTATNDTTTWLLSPPHAEANLASLEAVAQEHNPGWWRIRRAAR